MRVRLRRTWRTLLAIVLGMTAFGGCVAPPKRPATLTPGDYGYTKQYLTWLINQQMARHKVVGLSIALLDDQKVVWAEGFGYAKRSEKRPATAETVYEVGSISKLFTATAVMQLAEAGKIDIDQPLRKYVPQFSIKTRFPDAGPITPRTILTHHSGLPGDRLQGMFTSTPAAFTQVATLLQQEYAAYPPNFMFSYSNLGFTLLGHLVQQVSGRDFVAYMDESVLGPMGMTRSSFVVTPQIAPLLAKAYVNGKETEAQGIRDMPAGSLVSNVLDLSRLMMMVFADGKAGERRIIKSQTLGQMMHPQNADVPLDVDVRIGLAWFLIPRGLDYAGPVASHGGGTIGYTSLLVCLPKHKLGVVVLTNSDTGNTVAGKVTTEALKLMVETKTGITPPKPEKKQEPAMVCRSAQELREFEGYYATSAGVIAVKAEGRRLRTKLDGTPIRLLPLADGRFLPRYYLLGLFPLRVEDLEGTTFSIPRLSGRRALIAYQNGVGSVIGEKIDRPPIPQRWQRLVGSYEVPDRVQGFSLLKSVRVRCQDGFLLMETTLYNDETVTLPVKPISETEGIIMGLGRHRGETVFVGTRDGQDTIRYSGYVFKKKGG